MNSILEVGPSQNYFRDRFPNRWERYGFPTQETSAVISAEYYHKAVCYSKNS